MPWVFDKLEEGKSSLSSEPRNTLSDMVGCFSRFHPGNGWILLCLPSPSHHHHQQPRCGRKQNQRYYMMKCLNGKRVDWEEKLVVAATTYFCKSYLLA
jgi:hypothetical protein